MKRKKKLESFKQIRVLTIQLNNNNNQNNLNNNTDPILRIIKC